MKKFITVAIALALLVSANAVYAASGYSYAEITLHSTGEWGDDDDFLGDYLLAGNQDSDATNTLWIAAEKERGGLIETIPCASGASTMAEITVEQETTAHVLLDPAGPNFTGCHGWGEIG